jgi:N-acetylated-alpha-linked acidic dipeptidase
VANADVLPYDYAEYARTMRRYLPAIERAFAERRWAATQGSSGSSATAATATTPLRVAIDRMEEAARGFGRERDAALAGAQVPKATLERTNRALMRVERALTRPQGLRTRPWFRNLIYAADENNGYANMALPSVNEAIRAGDLTLSTREIADLAARFDVAARALDDARAALALR